MSIYTTTFPQDLFLNRGGGLCPLRPPCRVVYAGTVDVVLVSKGTVSNVLQKSINIKSTERYWSIASCISSTMWLLGYLYKLQSSHMKVQYLRDLCSQMMKVETPTPNGQHVMILIYLWSSNSFSKEETIQTYKCHTSVSKSWITDPGDHDIGNCNHKSETCNRDEQSSADHPLVDLITLSNVTREDDLITLSNVTREEIWAIRKLFVLSYIECTVLVALLIREYQLELSSIFTQYASSLLAMLLLASYASIFDAGLVRPEVLA